jgi:hypothetical protein
MRARWIAQRESGGPMATFLTRHSEDFILTEGRIDPSRSPYTESFDAYTARVATLARIVGAGQFLWAVEAITGFRVYEMCKPVEWEIVISPNRIIGYIDDEKWFAILNGESTDLSLCFSASRPQIRQFSVLLPFPLRVGEITCRRTFHVENPHKACLLHEESF